MPTDPSTIPLSLSYYTVPELTPPAVIDVAAATGCRFVGLRLLGGQPSGEGLPIMTDAALQRETRRRLADTGIEVLDANSARLLPQTQIKDFARFLEVAAGFGARHVLASCDDPDEARLADKLSALAQDAAALGLTVEIEFVPWMSIASVRDAARIIAAAGVGTLGIAVDALHFDRSGGMPEDLAAVSPALFRYLQICDAPKPFAADRDALFHTAVKERLFPGEGGIDLVGLLRAMPRGLPIALEIPTETLARTMPAGPRVARAVAATRRVLQAAYGDDE